MVQDIGSIGSLNLQSHGSSTLRVILLLAASLCSFRLSIAVRRCKPCRQDAAGIAEKAMSKGLLMPQERSINLRLNNNLDFEGTWEKPDRVSKKHQLDFIDIRYT